jgi:uncharacterized RDD family membrane protein YckC
LPLANTEGEIAVSQFPDPYPPGAGQDAILIWGNGQTPALQVLGMRVWQSDTNRVAGFWRMALREIVGRFVEGLLSVITELTSFVLFAASKDHKTLHDHIAGTVVL